MNLRYLMLEVRRAYRNKRFLIFTIALPLVLYLVYVQLYGKGSVGSGGVDTRAYLMTSMAGFGAMTASMSAGVRIAVERHAGWNRQLRLTPLAPSGYVLAKVIVAMLVAIPAILLVYAAAGFVEHVKLDPAQWLASGIGIWLGIIPFAAIGVVIGYLTGPDSSQAVYSATFMVMALFGGIFVPTEVMPETMARIAQVLPSYWLGILARGPLGHASFDWTAVPVLAAWAVLAGVIVVRRFRVDTARA